MVFEKQLLRNYFVIDSNNLEQVESHLYGYAITEYGFFDDERMKSCDNASTFDGCGTYVLVSCSEHEIEIRQDFGGDFGLFTYEDGDYFAVSNSFHLLVEHVKTDHPLSINRDYCNFFLVTWIVSLADIETAVNEIRREPANAVLRIGIKSKSLCRDYIDYGCNSIPIDTAEAVETLDRWYAKWLGITSNTIRATNNLRIDLSGGIDSRLTFLFALNSGIDLNDVYVHSLNDGLHTHGEDYQIASSIAERYGFELNNSRGFDDDVIPFTKDECFEVTFLSKMLFQKEPSFPFRTHANTHYFFGGSGGEIIRPYWNYTPQEFVEHYLGGARSFGDVPYAAEACSSTERLLEDSLQSVGERYGMAHPFTRDISINMFRDCYSRNHFGRINVESILCNSVRVTPIMDPLLQKLSLSCTDCTDKNLLVCLIFTRYREELLGFSFDKGRKFDEKTCKFARELCDRYPMHKGSLTRAVPDTNFSLLSSWNGRAITTSQADSFTSTQAKELFVRAFCGDEVHTVFCSQFPEQIYTMAGEFYKVGKYFPTRHIASVLAVTDLLETLSDDAEKPGETWGGRLERWAASAGDSSLLSDNDNLQVDVNIGAGHFSIWRLLRRQCHGILAWLHRLTGFGK